MKIVFIALLIAGAGLPALSQSQTLRGEGNADKAAPVKRVLLNIRGDQKLAHRLWTYLQFELEDAGLTLVSTEKDADAVVDSEVKTETVRGKLNYYILRASLVGSGKSHQWDRCAGLSTGDAEMFSNLAEEVAKETRKEQPAAKSIQVVVNSHAKNTNKFRVSLAAALHSSGLDVIESPSTDAVLTVDLIDGSVSTNELVLRYTFEVGFRESSGHSRGTGDPVISATVTQSATPPCAVDVNNLAWLSKDVNESLFGIARSATKDLEAHNKKAVATTTGP